MRLTHYDVGHRAPDDERRTFMANGLSPLSLSRSSKAAFVLGL